MEFDSQFLNLKGNRFYRRVYETGDLPMAINSEYSCNQLAGSFFIPIRQSRLLIIHVNKQIAD